jgi:hypothetical protein
MKQFFLVAFVALLSACNNSTDTAKVESMKTGSDSTMRDINSPYAIGYSSKFVMDDPKNAETVLSLWKAWDSGDLSAAKDIFADSVEIHFSNGSMMHSVRDSVVNAAQNARNTITSSVSSVDAIMAVKSTDRNENWALIWGKEIDTDKKGKVDSFYLQETWRFDSSGKANFMLQYRQSASPAKK